MFIFEFCPGLSGMLQLFRCEQVLLTKPLDSGPTPQKVAQFIRLLQRQSWQHAAQNSASFCFCLHSFAFKHRAVHHGFAVGPDTLMKMPHGFGLINQPAGRIQFINPG